LLQGNDYQGMGGDLSTVDDASSMNGRNSASKAAFSVLGMSSVSYQLKR
jgi:hypothetical protein